MGASAVDRTIDARLATLDADAAATIRRRPSSTILPPDAAVDSRQGRAIGLLEDLNAGRAQPLKIQRTLGEGGMGVVHLAEQESIGRSVAVKTLREGHRDPGSAMRLLREAWVTGTLEHPNIVPVYDVAVDASGAPQVVLKRIEGVDWASLLADPRALREQAGADVEEWNLRTLMQVCDAMRFAHDRGILHRDLKPENVMIGKFGEVYVVDWGIAVTLKSDDNPRLPRASEATDLAGTPLYMAPEMLTGDPSRLTERTDVYLLGAILFEIASGKPPHEGSTLEAIFAHVLQSPPAVPSSVPREIADICRRAMANDPADRYASVAEFRHALSAYLEHRGSMRLAHRAQRRLTELLEELGDAGDRERIHHLFGECRFGFRAALDAWPENDVARGGLRLAIKSVADYEISAENVHAARLLVAELDDAPQDLKQRLAHLEKSHAADAVRRGHLEALERDLDPMIGSRTRTFATMVLGVVWTGLPIGSHFYLRALHRGPTIQSGMASAAVVLLVAAGLGLWARDSLMKTAVNRRTSALLAFAMVAQLVLGSALLVAGVDPRVGVALNFFVWSSMTGVAALTVEPRVWPSAVVYAVSLFAALRYPEAILLIMAAGNAALAVNLVVIWRPLYEGEVRPGKK